MLANYLRQRFDTSREQVIVSASITSRSFYVKVSGCPDKGRIGKRVRIPRGRATVMRHSITAVIEFAF